MTELANRARAQLQNKHLDLAGLLLMVAFVGSLQYPFEQGPQLLLQGLLFLGVIRLLFCLRVKRHTGAGPVHVEMPAE